MTTPTISRPDTDDVKAMAERLRNFLPPIKEAPDYEFKRWNAMRDAADLFDRISAQAQGSGTDWKCSARPRDAIPSDCGWPDCGCDPHVERVIEGLREGCWIVEPPAPHRVVDFDNVHLGDLVASVPMPSEDQKRIGEMALDDYYNGNKTEDVQEACAHVYRAMKAFSHPSAVPLREALQRLYDFATAQLRNTSFLMSNPPQSSAAWDIRNQIQAEMNALSAPSGPSVEDDVQRRSQNELSRAAETVPVRELPLRSQIEAARKIHDEMTDLEEAHGKAFLTKSMSEARYRYDELKRQLSQLEAVADTRPSESAGFPPRAVFSDPTPESIRSLTQTGEK